MLVDGALKHVNTSQELCNLVCLPVVKILLQQKFCETDPVNLSSGKVNQNVMSFTCIKVRGELLENTRETRLVP